MRRKVDVDEIDHAAQRVIEALRTVAIILRDREEDVVLVSVLDEQEVTPLELRTARLKRWNVVSRLAERARHMMDLLRDGGDLVELGASNLIQECEAAIEDTKASAAAESRRLNEELQRLLATCESSSQGLRLFCMNLFWGDKSGDTSEWSRRFAGLSDEVRAEVLEAVEKLPADSQMFFKKIFVKPPSEREQP